MRGGGVCFGISIHAPPRGATGRNYILPNIKTTFQFTPLREGRPARFSLRASCTYFNSRPSARGDKPAPRRSRGATYFNSRPSARGDPSRPASFSPCIISIHAPPRGATVSRSRLEYSTTGFQFTPLREGRLATSESPGVGKISIHAPPRGATRARGRVSVTCKFQFTPLREGRPTSNVRHILPFDFNSRPSARGDVPAACASASTAGISIHAPPRGATCREVRAPRPCHFNSRPSARGDADPTPAAKKVLISIHAPPRGATGIAQAERPHGMISIHAPPRGATLSALRGSRTRYISIHAPPRGATVPQGL